jgi:excisionase family DNA binding protein
MPIDSEPGIDLLTIPEAAKLLKISVSGMRRLQRSRRIPFIKVGGSIRLARQDVLSFVQGNRVEAIGAKHYGNTNHKKMVVG